MDFSVVKGVIDYFENYDMASIQDVVNTLNKRVGVDVYHIPYYSGDSIYLKDFINKDIMVERGFLRYYHTHYPVVKSLYPLNITQESGLLNNLIIVPEGISVLASISKEAKKTFIKDYFSKLRQNSKGNLLSLTYRKKEVDENIRALDVNNETETLHTLKSGRFLGT